MLLEGNTPRWSCQLGAGRVCLIDREWRSPFQRCYSQENQLCSRTGARRWGPHMRSRFTRVPVCWGRDFRSPAGTAPKSWRGNSSADALAALQSYGRACELGSTEGCVNTDITAVELNRRKSGSIELFEQGCEGAEAGACALLAVSANRGWRHRRSQARERALPTGL